MSTAELDEGLQAIVDERPGAIIPVRVEQLQQEIAKMGRLGAMATKFHLWELGVSTLLSTAPAARGSGAPNGSGSDPAASAMSSAHGAFDQIAYYDADHVFITNADRIFQDCGCDYRFCGVWDPRQPAHVFPRSFGQPAKGNYTRRLVNAGMMVIQPEASYGELLRKRWTKRAEVLVGKDAGYILTGSDQVWFNYMMGSEFKLLDDGYNVGHISRKDMLNSNLTEFVKYIYSNGSARNEAQPTVVHLKPWLRGRIPVETTFHRNLLRRFANPYVRQLLKDKRCNPIRRGGPQGFR